MLNTKISWCDHTWSAWIGCAKVSPACDNCYAEVWAKRYGRDFTTVQKGKTTFHFPLKKSVKSGDKIFVCALSDFFHEDVPSEWVDDALEIMSKRSDVSFLLLTKRPQNIDKVLYGDGRFLGTAGHLENVWIGVTAENQAQYNKRVGALVRQGFAQKCSVRFVSCEPLLDGIDLRLDIHKEIDWVIVGGESGGNARQMKRRWVSALYKQCRKHDVTFFFKQEGRNPDLPMAEFDEHKIFPKVTKKRGE